jgi:hypothetical protein
MTSVTRLEIALVAFVAAIVILTFGALIVTDTHVPYQPVTGEPVRDALTGEGMTIVSVKDTTWNLPGATGGKTYVILDTDNRQTIISTQNFDSEASRDAAIRLWHTSGAGRGRPAGSLIVAGQHLIFVTPDDRPVIALLGGQLARNH